MHFNRANKTLLGPILWVSSIQYFIVQLIVIAAWPVPHSLANNFISDLGNTECGVYAGLQVCSPLWPLMNLSFVVFGITMSVGSMLIRKQFEKNKLATIAFALMVVSGVGTMMVGLFPENTIGWLHTLGAFLGLGVGNLSVLLLGIWLRPLPTALRVYTIASGIICLAAFTLFLLDIYLGLGRGGMERLVSYPFTLWMIIFGIYMAGAVRKRQL